MMYIEPEINIEYDREWFEPEGDEILIMQQHCGGENLIVYRGASKPNGNINKETTLYIKNEIFFLEIFAFESRRHVDYPFALAFYLNGVINIRLSICCESRCNGFTRIGGKHGLFAITNVENGKPCRRYIVQHV